MDLGKRKRLWCPFCLRKKWARWVTGWTFKCEGAEHEFNLFTSQNKMASDRKAARAKKQKALGTYLPESSRKKKRKERMAVFLDDDYLHWVRKQRCVVPSCSVLLSDAHHSVHKSQGQDDRTAVPLCHSHHLGDYHQTLGSVEAAKEVWGIDLLALSREYYDRYKKWVEISPDPSEPHRTQPD